jgi:hypothetical protein
MNTTYTEDSHTGWTTHFISSILFEQQKPYDSHQLDALAEGFNVMLDAENNLHAVSLV